MSDIEPVEHSGGDLYAKARAALELPTGMQRIRRGFRHEGEYQQAMRKVRPEWMTPICQAIRVWEENADPSPVGPEWLPFPVLVALFAEHGVTDADAIGFTILRMQEQGLVMERGFMGVMAVRLLGPGRARSDGEFHLARALAPWAEPRQIEGPR